MNITDCYVGHSTDYKHTKQHHKSYCNNMSKSHIILMYIYFKKKAKKQQNKNNILLKVTHKFQ